MFVEKENQPGKNIQNRTNPNYVNGFILVGALLIAFSFICNRWVFFWLVEDTLLDNGPNKIFIWVFDIALIILGISIIKFKYEFLKNLLPLTVSVIFSFVLFVSFDGYLAYKNFMSELEDDKSTGHIENVHVLDNQLGWKPKPNAVGTHTNKGKFDVTYTLDQYGFKAVNNTGDADFNIYFFGDSYTFGHGVTNQDTFANILADEYVVEQIHIYNAGVMGYGITQMYQRFLDTQDQIKAGDIIIFTPLSQDIERNLDDFIFPAQFIFRDNIIKVEYYPYYTNNKLQYLKLDTLYNRIKTLLFYAPFTGRNFQFLHRLVTQPDATSDAVEMFKNIEAITTEKGARFVLFFLPKPKEKQRGYNVDITPFEYYDILQYYPSQEIDTETIKLRDGHWNRLGHEVTARAILETLIDEEIIDKKHLKYSTQPVDFVIADQVRVTKISQRLTGSHLDVDLVWQSIIRPRKNYTIFVQILDENNQRVTGVDELPNWGFTTVNPGDKIITHHEVPLPNKPGQYKLLIGLYYFEDDNLVNVGSFTLDETFVGH